MLPIYSINREQIEIEARAKVTWGDSREEVLKFIMMQGVSAAEATEMANEMFAERAKTIRGAGVRRMLIGLPLMAVPVATWFFFVLELHFVEAKILGLTILVGLYGLYSFMKGSIMFLSPKSEPGDVGDK